MLALWHRMGAGRRVLVLIIAALLVAGLAVSAMTWVATPHGSDAFNAGFAWGRILLQLAAATGIVGLLVIVSRPKKRR
ncbi:hypothetical protein [Arthrobacter sp. HY1533]|uniref:hypothetical protein n=1 Tax=Arthrobacter sp. HY1533 TaxID=2970919 RepID=UPI0022B9ECC8|nr:hypothetical protein [Arthrobacter sp. HY1533]